MHRLCNFSAGDVAEMDSPNAAAPPGALFPFPLAPFPCIEQKNGGEI
jgi:hypothetical protein